MERAAGQDEEMPDGMVVRQATPAIENETQDVGEPSGDEGPRIFTSTKGVYVPAIKRKMAAWSRTRRTVKPEFIFEITVVSLSFRIRRSNKTVGSLTPNFKKNK